MKKLKEFFKSERFKYPLHTLSHPADGYYEIRHRGMGSVPLALIFVVIYSICFSSNRIMASFVVNDVNERNVNALTELIAVFALYFLFCVGNWSVTCLMGGEGRFKDIVIAVGYATLPLTLTIIPATIISQGIAANEEAFYGIIIGLGTAYALFMGFVGLMTVHNFTLGKTILAVFLTFVAMFVIIFVFVLLTDLVNQVYEFFHSIYLELLYRG